MFDNELTACFDAINGQIAAPPSFPHIAAPWGHFTSDAADSAETAAQYTTELTTKMEAMFDQCCAVCILC